MSKSDIYDILLWGGIAFLVGRFTYEVLTENARRKLIQRNKKTYWKPTLPIEYYDEAEKAVSALANTLDIPLQSDLDDDRYNY